jgi:hypothetical protein
MKLHLLWIVRIKKKPLQELSSEMDQAESGIVFIKERGAEILSECHPHPHPVRAL